MKITLPLASLTVLALVALPAAAFADTVRHSDPAQDVQKVKIEGHGQTVTNTPTQKSADITHFTAGYTADGLTESTRLRAISGSWSYESLIETPTGRFDLELNRIAGHTEFTLTQGDQERPVTCTGLAKTIDAADGLIGIQIPADCLGTPAWVQVGAGMIVLPKSQGAPLTVYADDALRKGGVAKENDLTLSKRLLPSG